MGEYLTGLPMRYSREHKIETHARIVKRASVQLRQKGAHGVGVADLMKDAGLTHGGFYAHFDSREAAGAPPGPRLTPGGLWLVHCVVAFDPTRAGK